MPDFFDRLLARSMPAYDGGVVPVRPRVPGRFERAAPLPDLEELPGTPAAATRERVVREVDRVVTGPAPAMLTDRPAEPAPAPRIVEHRAERVTEVHRETVAVQREKVTREVVESRAVPLAAREVVREAPARPALPATSRVVVEVRPLLVPPKVDAVPAPAVVARRDPAVPAQPTVHVRIGRIEVAAPAAAEPKPHRRGQRAEPVLSLERYLDGSGQ